MQTTTTVDDDRMSPEMSGEDEHGRQKPSNGIAASVILSCYLQQYRIRDGENNLI